MPPWIRGLGRDGIHRNPRQGLLCERLAASTFAAEVAFNHGMNRW